MWSRFRQRGKSITLDTQGPTANAKATSPTPQLSLDGSEDEDDDEGDVRLLISFYKCNWIFEKSNLVHAFDFSTL